MKKDKGDRVTPILDKQITGTNVMRGRDIRARLDGRNIDPILIDTIARLAEINHVNMTAIAELSTMLDQTINVIQQFADISQNMKDKMQQLERGTRAEVEGDESAADTQR